MKVQTCYSSCFLEVSQRLDYYNLHLTVAADLGIPVMLIVAMRLKQILNALFALRYYTVSHSSKVTKFKSLISLND